MKQGLLLYNDKSVQVQHLPESLAELRTHVAATFDISDPVLTMFTSSNIPVLLDSDQTYYEMMGSADCSHTVVVESPDSHFTVLKRSLNLAGHFEDNLRKLVREELNVLLACPHLQLVEHDVRCSGCKSPQILGTRYYCHWCSCSFCSMCEEHGDHEHPLFKQTSLSQILFSPSKPKVVK